VALFDTWCESNEEENARKYYWLLSEKKGGREAIRKSLAKTMRSHYDRLERIADDVARLGYKAAATILAAELPKRPRARSGDIGEILATEFVKSSSECRFGGCAIRMGAKWRCAATISSAPDMVPAMESFGS
jgi:hypothetical protein